MDPITTFIASTMAGAVLKEVANDAYKALRARLVEHFGLQPSIAALESSPDDEAFRQLMARKLAETKADKDPLVLKDADRIGAELERLPDDTRLGPTLTVRDIRALSAEFRRIRVHGGGSATFEKMNIEGRLIVEDNEVGDDRKR